MADRVQIYHRHYSEKYGRSCQFWFNAERPGQHMWRMRMNADYVPSREHASDRDPYEVAVEMLNEWKASVT